MKLSFLVNNLLLTCGWTYFGMVIEVNLKFWQCRPSQFRFGWVGLCDRIHQKLIQSRVQRWLIRHKDRNGRHKFRINLSCLWAFNNIWQRWWRTLSSFEVVNMHCFKHVSKKSTWSRSSWSTVCTLASFSSSAFQLGSSTSPVANASTCRTKASILVLKEKIRAFHLSISSLPELFLQDGLLCSSHMAESADSRWWRWRRKRKMSW